MILPVLSPTPPFRLNHGAAPNNCLWCLHEDALAALRCLHNESRGCSPMSAQRIPWLLSDVSTTMLWLLSDVCTTNVVAVRRCLLNKSRGCSPMPAQGRLWLLSDVCTRMPVSVLKSLSSIYYLLTFRCVPPGCQP
jgi:hypothetical protein